MTDFTVISETRDRVGESPVWSVAQQALYWVDIESRLIRRWQADTGLTQTWPMPERVGCIALAADGRVIAAMESGIFAVTLLAPPAATLICLARIRHPLPGMRCNDGRCDAQGRLWVGTMCMDMALAEPAGGLFCLDERGFTGPHVEGLITPNGLGFSPDGGILYLSDSHPKVQKIWTFDLDVMAPRLSARRLWVDMNPLPGRPDGAAVDAEGCYWICGNDAGQVHRFNAEGRLLSSLAVPVSKPSMCAFGGPDLQTLFVTSILPASVAADAPGLHGAVLALDVAVPGRPEPLFTRFPSPIPFNFPTPGDTP